MKILARSPARTVLLCTIALTGNGVCALAGDTGRYNWSGFYGGGGYGPNTSPAANDAAIFPASATGFIGGFQSGYSYHAPNNIVLGAEADITFISPRDERKAVLRPYDTTVNFLGTALARLGYASGYWLPYITGGLAFGKPRVSQFDSVGDVTIGTNANHWGWTVGAGLEFALTGAWTAKLEYNYLNLGAETYYLQTPAPQALAVEPHFHLVKLGLNYRFGDIARAAPAATRVPESDAWSIHGQTTFITQGYGRFRSPYQAANSLPGNSQVRETWTTTAFVGRKLWDGGEIYINPELAQGSGLAGTLGLGGFSNGEAQKAGGAYPRVRAQRYFFRQTFGFGGEQETVEDGPNQIAGKRDVDRVTLTVGRFAIGDFFDGNSYAHDPRVDFMNWAMWSAAAYDFPADLPGYTRGAVAELNRKDWAVRAGLFQVPNGPNSDVLKFNTGGGAIEFERRYEVFAQPGKFRVGVFSTRGKTANYRETITAAVIDPTLDINDAALANRATRPKNGIYANVEQAVASDVGVFGRASWNDGRNQILSFTDIDRSVSGGVSVKGVRWGRATDTFGFGGAVNGLSRDHRDFLAAGGLGLLIGDGAINYRTERILETFYAVALTKASTLTFDYQFVANPAYNADRGPVSIFSTRFHAEF